MIFIMAWLGLRRRGVRLCDGQRKVVVVVSHSLEEGEYSYEGGEHVQIQVENHKKTRRR